MGSVRQRRKQRSSLPKVRPKSKPKLTNPKSNPVIARNWDKRLTLTQNYRKLGLTVKLNAPAGGIEKITTQLPGSDNLAKAHQDSLAIVPSKTRVDPTDVHVERDLKTGRILKITDPAWNKSHSLNDPLNALDDETKLRRVSEGIPDFVRDLEHQASNAAPPKSRPQSQREQEWLQELVDKHGDDYAKMMRDRKLNVYQLSEGDIRSRIKKWKAIKAKTG